MRESVQVNGHSIEIYASVWSGKEAVKYDGVEVSTRNNWRTFISSHSFMVQEVDEEVTYEVQIFGGLGQAGYALRRNGVIKAHKP